MKKICFWYLYNRVNLFILCVTLIMLFLLHVYTHSSRNVHEKNQSWPEHFIENDIRMQFSFTSKTLTIPDKVLEEECRYPVLNMLKLLYNYDHDVGSIQKLTVAIGLGITSWQVKNAILTPDAALKNFQFFTMFSSFCATASPGYFYHFYIAFDVDDIFFQFHHNQELFLHAFLLQSKLECLPRGILTRMHLVWCQHSRRSAWAHNDALMEAYWDNNEYFYQVVDDIIMQERGWVETYINTLMAYKPSNVGVTGPDHHRLPVGVLCFDFVHKTHINIFGYHFPRTFAGMGICIQFI